MIKKTGTEESKVTKKKVVAKKAASKKKVAAAKPAAAASKPAVTKKAPAVKKAPAKKAPVVKKKVAAKKETKPVISPRERYEMIATMAYYRAEQRNFAPGNDEQDWFECEQIIDEMLKKS